MRFLLFLVLFALAPMAVHAQDGEASRRAAAERYIMSDGQQRMLDQILSPEVMSAQLAAQFPQIPAAQRGRLAAIASDEIKKVRPLMEKAMIDAAVATFTTSEIEALDAFYRTPEGAAVLTKMQPFMQRSFQAMGPAMQTMQRSIAGRVQEMLKQ